MRWLQRLNLHLPLYFVGSGSAFLSGPVFGWYPADSFLLGWILLASGVVVMEHRHGNA